jgi:amidase
MVKCLAHGRRNIGGHRPNPSSDADNAMDDITTRTVSEIASAIRCRNASAIEVLDAHLARVDTLNGDVNALVSLRVEQARKRALEADRATARGESWGPLHGVPVALKDCHDVHGLPSTCGATWWARHEPQANSPVIDRLVNAGAIVFGRTNVAELLADFQCANPVFGRTSNPWNLECTSGGSSGGAAAAVAAGMTPFDIGTDLSGSIRLPASFCGVFGLKPTERRVSVVGSFPNPQGGPRPVRHMLCIGPIARSVSDLGLLLGLIAGPDGFDADVPPVALEPVAATTPRPPRVAVSVSIAGLPVARDVAGVVRRLAAELAAAGFIVDEVPVPADEQGGDLQAAAELVAMMLGSFQPAASSGASRPGFEDYLRAMDRRDRSMMNWDRFFEQWDALLCPTTMVEAFTHRPAGTPIDVDGADIPYFTVAGHTALFNYTGHPAVSIPCETSARGLPIGVQLIGPRWSEMRLLQIAEVASSVRGGFRPAPWRPGR